MNIFDKFIETLRRRNIQPQTILDVGAHDGQESLRLSRAFPQAHVHAFEAHPQFYGVCRENASKTPNVAVYQRAVGDENGTVPFYVVDTTRVPRDPGASSLLRVTGQFDVVLPLPQRQTHVQGIRLETWAREYGIDSCEVLWIDVQGAERKVLDGMGPLLDTVEAICLEVSYQSMYQDQPLYPEIDRYLFERGFCCVGHDVVAEHWWGNAIYVRREKATLPKARSNDFEGRIAEVLSDPTNLLLPRHRQAGWTKDGCTTMRNGLVIQPMTGFYGRVIESARGTHEPQQEYVFERLVNMLPPCAAIIELGAWWSFYALTFAQLISRPRCILVERNQQRLAQSRRNFHLNGCTGLHIHRQIDGNHTLLSVFDELGVDYVEVLHADIDGGELQLLRGARQIFAKHQVGCMFLSTHSQPLHEACRSLLLAHRYRIVAEADFAHGTFSHDGLLVACGRRFPPVKPILLPQRVLR